MLGIKQGPPPEQQVQPGLEAEASLVYIWSSRPVRAQNETLFQNKTKQKKRIPLTRVIIPDSYLFCWECFACLYVCTRVFVVVLFVFGGWGCSFKTGFLGVALAVIELAL